MVNGLERTATLLWKTQGTGVSKCEKLGRERRLVFVQRVGGYMRFSCYSPAHPQAPNSGDFRVRSSHKSKLVTRKYREALPVEAGTPEPI